MPSPIPVLQHDVLLYLAGIMDGEGCCLINKAFKHGKDAGSCCYTPTVKIVLTHEGVVKFLADKLNHPYSHIKSASDKNWKDTYRVSVCDLEGVGVLLRQLIPHLIVKKAAAEVLLSFCDSRNKLPNKRSERHYSNFEIDCHAKLKTLNHRGRVA